MRSSDFYLYRQTGRLFHTWSRTVCDGVKPPPQCLVTAGSDYPGSWPLQIKGVPSLSQPFDVQCGASDKNSPRGHSDAMTFQYSRRQSRDKMWLMIVLSEKKTKYHNRVVYRLLRIHLWHPPGKDQMDGILLWCSKSTIRIQRGGEKKRGGNPIASIGLHPYTVDILGLSIHLKINYCPSIFCDRQNS